MNRARANISNLWIAQSALTRKGSVPKNRNIWGIERSLKAWVIERSRNDRHSTLAAGLAKVTLYGYTGVPFLETLVEPETPLTPKSMGERTNAPQIKTCKVYPNPTAGILMIEIPTEFEEVEVTVRNASGKVVHRETIGNGMVTLNLRSLASGSYVLHLQNADGALNETHQIQIAK